MTAARPALLPYSRQAIEDDDIAAVAAALKGDYLTTGPYVTAFEQAVARAVKAADAVAVSSATAGLHLACLAVGLGPGKRAVVPSITFLSTANAVRMTGADVVFADVDPDTGLMGPAELRAALARCGGSADAVLPVHFAGRCADLAALAQTARAAGAAIVEDAAHAFGADYAQAGETPAPIGANAHADLTVFSFHAVKPLVTGEGGAVTAANPENAAAVRRLRNHAVLRAPERFANADLACDRDGAANPWYYEAAELGFNYRMTDVACALGLSQLAKAERHRARRARLASLYDAALAPLTSVVRPLPRTPWCGPAWHLYGVLIDFAAAGLTRAALMRVLAAQGVGTQVHYIPVHRQPYYERLYGRQDLPGAMRFYERELSLPLFPGMADADVGRVAGALARALG